MACRCSATTRARRRCARRHGRAGRGIAWHGLARLGRAVQCAASRRTAGHSTAPMKRPPLETRGPLLFGRTVHDRRDEEGIVTTVEDRAQERGRQTGWLDLEDRDFAQTGHRMSPWGPVTMESTDRELAEELRGVHHVWQAA